MNDSLFWTRLAFIACGWLRGADEPSFRRFWIDDFSPEKAANTKRGVDIEGTAWIGDGPRVQHPYCFVASIPQKMLYHRGQDFFIEQLVLDELKQTLQVRISHGKQVA